MTGAVAQGKKEKDRTKAPEDERDHFESYIAAYRAEQALQKNPALQAELHGLSPATGTGTGAGSATTTGAKPKPVKKKKSRCVVS
ncbi:hypothetical protein ACN47E_002642 [Coniothyrium glycines]